MFHAFYLHSITGKEIFQTIHVDLSLPILNFERFSAYSRKIVLKKVVLLSAMRCIHIF